MAKYYTILFLLLKVLFISGQNNVPDRYALLVGISKYQNDIEDLNCYNDILYLKDALSKYGFKEQNILVLEDQDATKNNIIHRIKTHLINQCKSGDIAFFHFSGHGQQINDLNNDELDGFDESLVCYGAKANFNNYNGEEHFTDDELGNIMKQLQEKIGNKGSILATFDACYSGTITRSLNKVRGLPKNDFFSENKIKTTIDVSGISDDSFNLFKGNSPLTVISASRHDQPNYETRDVNGKPVGSLSYSLSKALNESQNNTYRALFDRIKSIMVLYAPNQSPQAEGNLDIKIFAKDKVEQEVYFKVKEVIDKKKCIINAGLMSGLLENSIVSFHPVGTSNIDTSEEIAKGIVEKSDELTSIIKLTNNSNTNISNTWVFVHEYNLSSLKVKICIDIEKRKNTIKYLKEVKYIEIVDKDRISETDLLIKDSYSIYNEYQLLIININNQDTIIKKIDEKSPKFLSETITFESTKYARASYLRSLSFLNPKYNIAIELVPVKYDVFNDEIVITQKYDPLSKFSKGGNLKFVEGDVFYFRLINNGNHPAYFTVIDIQSNNDVMLLLPDQSLSYDELKLNPKESIEFKSNLIQIGSPFGKDVIKVIATPTPLNYLADILQSNNSKQIDIKRASLSNLENILISNFYPNNRGMNKMVIPKKALGISTTIIEVQSQ